jgi:lipopolysaccharide/colanic/teichoic acid biosynthesis glycosyltransferase
MKPGITCTWQIMPRRNEIRFERWMKLDIQYIENWSIKKDLILFFKTIKTVISAESY